MASIYHILDVIPAIYKEDMLIEYENLAQLLIKSGRIRIDTGYSANFVRFSDPSLHINFMATIEEITDKDLIEKTRSRIKKQSKISISETQIDKIFSYLNSDAKKLSLVSLETKEMLTRLLVQSTHPIILRWLLYDDVEIFISYSHNIGDMMDIVGWQRSGSNSGMQSTDGKNTAVFVSCGGDPFAENDIKNPSIGDGWASVARLQIIAAQELGHFSDIKRDDNGRQVDRHSANFSATKAKDHVKIGRQNDINICNLLYKNLIKFGIEKLINYEKQLKFYSKNNVNSIKVLFIKLIYYFYRFKFLYKSTNEFLFIKKFKQDDYIGLMLQAVIDDMKLNLTPEADVYKDSNPEIEEAIACVEALARVPQQVKKWGHLTTKATMTNLYKIYYNEVIISLIDKYELVMGEKYRPILKKNTNMIAFFKKWFIFRKKLTLIPTRYI